MGISQLRIARLLAVEVLLAEPEALQDDVLESCLYIMRDRLQGKADNDESVTPDYQAGRRRRPEDDEASE